MRRSRWAMFGVIFLALAGVVAGGLYWGQLNKREIWVAQEPAPQTGEARDATPADTPASGPSTPLADEVRGRLQAALYPSSAHPAGIPANDEAPPATTGAERSYSTACPSLQDVYAAISRVTEGKEITEILSALGQIQADPQGARDAPSGLALELRSALNLTPAASPCESTLRATEEALRLARLAAGDGEETAAIGQRPAVTSTFAALPYGSPEGAGGSGYGAQ